MIDILEAGSGIWILEEEGQNVLLVDCQRFGIGRQARKSLFDTLSAVAAALADGEDLKSFLESGLLKKLTRQKEAVQQDLWEIRAEGRGERLLFAMRKPDSIIVAAVDKAEGSLSQAINRGVKRWKRLLKEIEKSRLPRHWV